MSSTYQVQSGDTLSGIGAKLGVPYQQITGYKSGNPNLIYAGETLNIPTAAGQAPAISTNGGSPTPVPPAPAPIVPQQNAPTGVSTPTGTSSPSSTGFDSNALISALVSKGYNQTDAQNAAVGPRAAELAKEYLGVGGNTAGSASGSPMLNTPTIDLPGIYQGLYKSSGVSDLEDQLSKQTQGFNTAVSKINDDPYLSEANRVGRVQKLQTDYNNNTAGIRSDITTRKADINTQLSIDQKQFDINSQQANQALSQFNSLLASGSLSNATPDDIASITRATGMSSSMIQNAIKSTNAKNSAAKTQVIQFDDGTNTGFAVVNSQTGDIINKQVVAASKPTKYSGGGGDTSTTPTKAEVTQSASQAAQSGKTYQDMLSFFVQYGLSPTDIYKIYTATNYYGRSPDNVDPKTGLYKSQ